MAIQICRNETCSREINQGKAFCSKACYYSSKNKKHRNKWERGQELIDRSPKNIDPFLSGVISGFTCGEGSFYINIGKSKTHSTGVQINPIFAIHLKKSDKEILEKIKETLGCGSISCHNDTVGFVVRKLQDHLEVIIPFFEKHPLLNVKKFDFEYYKLICFKLAKGEGKYIEGIKRILSIRNLLNSGGAKTRKKISL